MLAGGTSSNLMSVKETKASLENFATIWSKPLNAMQEGAKIMQASAVTERVF